MRQKTFPVIDPAATGANIVRLRRARGLSVRDLQAYFGFEEPQAIYKWQKGKSLPSVDNLYALGALLEVPMEEILVSTDSKWNELVCEQQADACCSGLSISPPAKGFGGKDSVKGNRQGSLSRWIRQLFETFLKFQKVLQRVEKTFSTRWSSRQMPAALRILGGGSVQRPRIRQELAAPAGHFPLRAPAVPRRECRGRVASFAPKGCVCHPPILPGWAGDGDVSAAGRGVEQCHSAGCRRAGR